MFFACVSGSRTADISAIGSLLIPAMKKEGYSGAYAAAVTAASSTIGNIIPPGIVMILIALRWSFPSDRCSSRVAFPTSCWVLH